MGRKTSRLTILIVTCGALGVVFGATSSQAEIAQCQVAVNPTNECLTQDPFAKRLEGISMGLMAGVGAALGATFQIKHKDK